VTKVRKSVSITRPETRRSSKPVLVPVSVAVTTLDRPSALARCLDSLAAGSTLPTEVVVVDQSPTRTAEAVAAGSVLPSIRYIHDRGVGLGRGQNIAVFSSEEDVVAVIDDDCVAAETWIETMYRVIAIEGVDLVAGRVLPLPEHRPDFVPVSLRPSETRMDFHGKDLPWTVGSGNNFGVRRAWFEKIGGCDERLGPGSPALGGVDMDLFYRLLRAGVEGRYEPTLVVYHEQKPRSARKERRTSYGVGMGAACALWLREGGDRYALRVLSAWFHMRSRRLLSGLRRGQATTVREELMILGGTFRGMAHGFRIAGRRPPA
jgi:O-antigen biosynthesis protein